MLPGRELIYPPQATKGTTQVQNQAAPILLAKDRGDTVRTLTKPVSKANQVLNRNLIHPVLRLKQGGPIARRVIVIPSSRQTKTVHRPLRQQLSTPTGMGLNK